MNEETLKKVIEYIESLNRGDKVLIERNKNDQYIITLDKLFDVKYPEPK